MKIDISTIVVFDKPEIDVLISWYKNAYEKESRYGGSSIVLPEEEFLINRIKQSENIDLKIDEFDIEIIYDWIEHSFFPQLGTELTFFPNEESTYRKIQLSAEIILLKKKEQEEIDKQNAPIIERKRSIKTWISNKLKKISREKAQKHEKEKFELEILDRKIKNVAVQLAPLMDEKNKKKNRPIDEKIAASNQLKTELDELRKKLKF